MKNKRKILLLCLSIVLVLTSFSLVFASVYETPVTIIQLDKPVEPEPDRPSPPPEVNISVPTKLPTVTSGKNTLKGSCGSIKNNGYSSVSIDEVKIIPSKGWTLVPGNTDKNKLGKGNKIGLKINGIPNDSKGNFDFEDISKIKSNSELKLSWNGVYNTTSKQKEIQAATISFSFTVRY